MKIDTLINARWIAPVTDGDPVLEGHAVAIKDGRILELPTQSRAAEKYRANQVHDLSEHLVIPGLINAHTHAAMSLFRGLADDLPLMTWLNDHIWPAEQRWAREEFIADGTRLAAAEMLRGGVTCFNDMYFFPDVTARVVESAGMRAVVGLILIDFPSAWAENPDEYLERGLALHDRLRDRATLHTAFAPHAPYSVSDAPLARVAKLAAELNIPVHMHVHETDDEIRMGLERYAMRPLARLERLGLLDSSLVGVHMTHLQDDEITAYANAGGHVVHCPESNLKLASGFCPVQRLLDAGVNVALGTDSAASNNDLDMLGEMRTAALLGKGVAGDAAALPAEQALRMATINGARALGIAAETGSLEKGKAADITAIDLSHLNTRPLYHPISQLIYASHRNQVSDVWVAGRQVLRQGRLTTLDETAIRVKSGEWQQRLQELA